MRRKTAFDETEKARKDENERVKVGSDRTREKDGGHGNQRDETGHEDARDRSGASEIDFWGR